MFDIPQEATALDIIQAIDRWAWVAPVLQANDLWDILTALRGPDDDELSNKVKWVTTAVLRAQTLPRLASRAGALVNDQPLPRKEYMHAVDGHFQQHMEHGWTALMRQEENAQ